MAPEWQSRTVHQREIPRRFDQRLKFRFVSVCLKNFVEIEIVLKAKRKKRKVNAYLSVKSHHHSKEENLYLTLRLMLMYFLGDEMRRSFDDTTKKQSQSSSCIFKLDKCSKSIEKLFFCQICL